jgi:hypothetical protein
MARIARHQAGGECCLSCEGASSGKVAQTRGNTNLGAEAAWRTARCFWLLDKVGVLPDDESMIGASPQTMQVRAMLLLACRRVSLERILN